MDSWLATQIFPRRRPTRDSPRSRREELVGGASGGRLQGPHSPGAGAPPWPPPWCTEPMRWRAWLVSAEVCLLQQRAFLQPADVVLVGPGGAGGGGRRTPAAGGDGLEAVQETSAVVSGGAAWVECASRNAYPPHAHAITGSLDPGAGDDASKAGGHTVETCKAPPPPPGPPARAHRLGEERRVSLGARWVLPWGMVAHSSCLLMRPRFENLPHRRKSAVDR